MKCETCGAVFSTIEQLVKHLNENHSETTELEYDYMMMSCERCGGKEAKTSLFGHWSDETGEFIFAALCDKCNKELTAERNKEDLEMANKLHRFEDDIISQNETKERV